MGSGWIGVDLDGTLAHYDGWKGIEHIGKPVPLMMHRVHQWLNAGTTVKIFTARASYEPEREQVVKIIQDWCERHGLPRLDVTCVKDFACIEIWDDRAKQVEINTGRVAVLC